MGGLLIKSILEESPEVLMKVQTLILQPMNFQHALRQWLIQNRFTIKDEGLALEDGHIYEIIVAVHGQQESWNEIELEISPRLLEKREKLLKPFVLKKIERVESIIDKLENKTTENAIEKRKACERKLKQYKEVYQWIVQWEE
jgi:tRNA (adenine22-N1)-methyltransferase